MGRQLKGLLYFFITDVRHSFFIFWTILLSTLCISIFISQLLSGSITEMAFALSIPIYIYCSIMGFLTVKESIPFAVKMGATRKNIFISLGTFLFGIALIKALMANTLQIIITSINKLIGNETFVFMHPAQLLNDSWITRVIVDVSIMVLLLAIMFLLGLLFYKYGLLGGGSVVGVLVIVFLVGMEQGWIGDFFVDLYRSLSITSFYQVLLFGLVLYCITWTMLRRITSVKTR